MATVRSSYQNILFLCMQLWRRSQTFWIRVWMTRRCEYVYNCWRQGWTRRLLPLWSGSWGGSPLPLRSDPGLVAWVKHYHTLPTKFIFKSIVVVAYIPGHLFTLHPGHFECWCECNCTVTSFIPKPFKQAWEWDNMVTYSIYLFVCRKLRKPQDDLMFSTSVSLPFLSLLMQILALYTSLNNKMMMSDVIVDHVHETISCECYSPLFSHSSWFSCSSWFSHSSCVPHIAI